MAKEDRSDMNKKENLIANGKTVEEIENDDLFSDFTFSEIAPKLEIKTDDEELLKEFNT